MGAVVDLGAVAHEPTAPETEDHQFQTARASHVQDLDDADFLGMLDAVRVRRCLTWWLGVVGGGR